VGFVALPVDSAAAIVITLERSTLGMPDSVYLGEMILAPGGRSIRIAAR